jgi:hypothetical protein
MDKSSYYLPSHFYFVTFILSPEFISDFDLLHDTMILMLLLRLFGGILRRLLLFIRT